MTVDNGPRTEEELARYGPNLPEAAIRVQAEAVAADLQAQRDQWRKGFTRRRVLAGAGAVGVAGLANQIATTRVAFGAPSTTNRTLVVVFLRGGMDGLSVIVPRGDRNYLNARRDIAVQPGALLAGDSRFGLHPGLAPLAPFWEAGKMAAVHAVASPDASRSHFQAQDCLERGAASTAVHTGFLDRVLEQLGPGTTFRAVAEGAALPRSLVGGQSKLVLQGIREFDLNAGGGMREKTLTALKALYTGVGDHPLGSQAAETLKSISTARKIAQSEYQTTAQWPGGGFADQLKDVARLIKAKVGLRVAAVDIGGWDMHTNIGGPDGGDMRNRLNELAGALGAFATDLGPALDNTSIVTMSEFGRRVEANGNSGLDHGHGGVMLLLGGGMNGGKVHGKWPGLSAGALDQGDLAGANDYRDVVSELLGARMGVKDAKKIFPGYVPKKIGIFKS
ncbi:uncharacterized protein (DUF1501 family) [Asanoa ferruginea]|uniref:Uncharacterized protein (DUF1501 family) n=1 Tax=Asanoa ferruginea TaxID=53367 RepID=A0A3D9ZJ45_9ACTN|nr:DUF1501 domain-containing protein [Asanoa ferruginea]REF97295.1 uncharacterized protein (DUF1501 family) [Asanoa ferruginea]GIF49056.1 hypothetical protein Afe04nite_35950 [Asanoa ferruginea]